jgi:hypothetical protein
MGKRGSKPEFCDIFVLKRRRVSFSEENTFTRIWNY